jgi:hypothetical protein
MGRVSGTPRLHLLGVVGGGDSVLVKHLVEHYRSLGVESFKLIRHAESTSDPDYELIDHYARQSGITLHDTWLGPWDDKIHEARMKAVMAEYPDDWFVLVDLDEFHLYDRPLPELIEMCESSGRVYVKGCYIDRLALDGSFPKVDSSPLWEQYPLGGAITAQILDAIPLKIGLALGQTLISGGHHVGEGGKGLPRDQSYIQVHHFKWTGSVMQRTRRRIQRYETRRWNLAYDKVLVDAHLLVRYLDEHDQRIDVSDPRLYVARAGRRYDDHKLWPEIVADASRWEYE